MRVYGVMGAVAGVVLMCAAGLAQTGGRLLVAEKGEQALGIVDPATGKEIGKVSEGKLPGKDTAHEVTASRDGKLAYVPIYGDSGVGKPGTNGQTMVVIDVASQKIVKTVDFGHPVRPHLPVLGPPVAGHTQGLLYVTTELDKAVTVIDPVTYKILGEIPTGDAQSHMLTVSHDGRRGYTANVASGTVSVLDLTNRKLLKTIQVAKEVQRITISPDDKWVFTSDQGKPELDVIDTKMDAVAKRIPMESAGYGTAVTPDGHWLLVPMMAVNKIAVVDLKTDTVKTNIELAAGTHPQEALVRPDGKVAYVSCDHSGQVAEIDTATWTLKRMIDTGKVSDGLAWAK
ncbi:MAG TPA: cytochrome D1 domain-containing protein [Acidobacteriaceae bacterium]|jgi:YVTN family beta-propeller protein|nr:cytochrome D1 domain-containing protein [Acidobacteriaceae bacterium]